MMREAGKVLAGALICAAALMSIPVVSAQCTLEGQVVWPTELAVVRTPDVSGGLVSVVLGPASFAIVENVVVGVVGSTVTLRAVVSDVSGLPGQVPRQRTVALGRIPDGAYRLELLLTSAPFGCRAIGADFVVGGVASAEPVPLGGALPGVLGLLVLVIGLWHRRYGRAM